ncbi:MAG: hypothetical protein MJ113_06255 [Lachnospiraceae bacterium]|nr:hypothetical protein [Lachnospiraceae bacterium]
MKKVFIEIISVVFLLILVAVAVFFVMKGINNKKEAEVQKEYEVFNDYFKEKLFDKPSFTIDEHGATWGVISDFNSDGNKEMLLFEDGTCYRFYEIKNNEVVEMKELYLENSGEANNQISVSLYLIDGKWHYFTSEKNIIYKDENGKDYDVEERIIENKYRFYTYEDGKAKDIFEYEIKESSKELFKFERKPVSDTDMSKEELYAREVEMMGNINGKYFGMNLSDIMSKNYYQLITIDNFNMNK